MGWLADAFPVTTKHVLLVLFIVRFLTHRYINMASLDQMTVNPFLTHNTPNKMKQMPSIRFVYRRGFIIKTCFFPALQISVADLQTLLQHIILQLLLQKLWQLSAADHTGVLLSRFHHQRKYIKANPTAQDKVIM